MDLSEREFDLIVIDYPIVKQNIGNGLNESMGVIVWVTYHNKFKN